MTFWLVVRWTVFVVLLWWMIRAVFFGAPRLFSWPMFARVSNCRTALSDQDGRPVNPWRYVIHQDPGMNGWELQCLLDFLHEAHGIRAHGTVELVDHTGSHLLTVRDGHVVA